MLVLAFAAALCNAHPIYRLQAHTSPAIVRSEARGYARAQSRVAFTVIGPEGPDVPHALGHRRIAERFARESGATVSGMGASPGLARRALARALARFVAETKRELEREERSYERVTDNGRAQERGAAFGYPGGPDVPTPCRG